jgi:hypothetical protein
MKKPLFVLIALVLALGLALPMGTLATAATPPYLEVEKDVSSPSVVVGEPVTVTLTLTGAGNPIGERRPLDVILIMDRSGSMAWDRPSTRLSAAQDAAIAFIGELDPTLDQVGLVSYATDATLNMGLTSDFTSVESAINALSATGATNMGDAIYTANGEFGDNGRTDALQVGILLTDGLPNKPDGDGSGFEEPDAAYARTAAQAAHDADITLYTIGLGADISHYFLDDNPASEHTYNPGDPAGHPYDYDGLAYIGGGKYYHAPTGDDLQDIFEALAGELITIAGQNIAVTEVLPDWVHLYEPLSINPTPDEISPDGQTLTWYNLGDLSIGDPPIIITFDVIFDTPGTDLSVDDPASIITYDDYQGSEQTTPIPLGSITVNPLANTAPVANDDSATTNEDTPKAITLSGSDIETVELTFSIESQPSHGSLGSITDDPGTPGTPNTDTASVTYTPDANYNGPDSFTFKVNDGTLDSNTATVSITVNARRRGGGGSSGGTLYFTVDFQGEITKEPMSIFGRLLGPLEAPSPDGMHLLEMAKGTKTVDENGKIVKLIEIRETEASSLTANTVIVGNAYDFEPSNITFDQPIRLTLGYDNLPDDVASITLAYYTDTTGWEELKPEGGVVAGEGTLTAPVEHFTIFAILAEITPPPPPPESPPPPAPAAFKVDSLQITPSQSRIWEPVTFVMKTGEEVAVSAYVTNYGGQEGKYTAILKVNGATQATKEIILGSGQGQQIGFTLAEDEPGLYTVDIGGLSGEFVISMWTNWWLIGGIIAALILIGWLAWYYGYYRRRQ